MGGRPAAESGGRRVVVCRAGFLRIGGKGLPTVDHGGSWRRRARPSVTRHARRLLRAPRAGGRPATPVPPVGSGFRSVYGPGGLHGLVWEWTLDFNSALITGESRGDSALDARSTAGVAPPGPRTSKTIRPSCDTHFGAVSKRDTTSTISVFGAFAGWKETSHEDGRPVVPRGGTRSRIEPGGRRVRERTGHGGGPRSRPPSRPPGPATQPEVNRSSVSTCPSSIRTATA